MNKIKLASLLLFGLMAIACEKSLAQTDQNNQQSTTTPDPNAVTPDNSAQPAATDPNASTEPSNVTIDSTSTAAPAGTTTESTSTPSKPEPTTKIHIYSGKHDGNNVINPDPKN